MPNEPVNILGKCTGLNNSLDPYQFEVETDLSVAFNVIINESNAIERSFGSTSVLALTDGHSLFCDGGPCLVHQGSSMYEVASDLTLSAVKRTGMSGLLVDYTQVGDAIYFSNSSENGVYFGGYAISWDVDPYIGPDTNRYFQTSIPYFSHIAYFNGYMLGTIDNALFASDPGFVGLWEMKPIWMSNTNIIMIKPVEGGVFVSDNKNQFFLMGLEPKTFREFKIANYPAIEWSAQHGYIDSMLVDGNRGKVAQWLSKAGICLGMPDGSLVNLTINKIKMPNYGTLGASISIGRNIISTLR